MSDLAVIVPTRGRPGNIRKVISAWDFTNAWDVADLVLVVDADDPEIEGYREIWHELNSVVPEIIPSAYPVRLVEMTEWRPMVVKLNAAAAMLAEEGDHFALGFAGDDHLPQTINWAKTYVQELRGLGTGMVYGDDGYQGKKLSTEWAVTTDAVRALGRMVPAPVDHMYCDNAIMEMFDRAGALKHLPAIRIEHMHPIAGKAESDDQYKRVNSRDQFKRDRAAYEAWLARDLVADVAKIKALRPGQVARPTRQRSKPTMRRPPFPSSFKQIKAVTPDEVALALADFAMGVPADQEIVELGVYHAKTTLILAWGAQQGNGAHVTGIDPWDLPGNVYGDEMGSMEGARSWARYWVRGLGYPNHVNLIQAFSHEAAEYWVLEHSDAKQIGLIFIDGDHTEEGARRDVLAWAPHLAPGAIIAVDDYVNPNYPGVAAAIDALVADGTLDPVTVYHDRLGVTQLKVAGADVPRPAVAITSEGVSPSPYPAVAGQVAVDPVPNRAELEAEWERVDPEGVAALRESTAELDNIVSKRGHVQPDELIDVEDGTPIDDLNLPQLKALAKVRGIVLGARKDRRDRIIEALREGE